MPKMMIMIYKHLPGPIYEIMIMLILNLTHHREVHCRVRFDLAHQVIWSDKVQQMQV
jgi:hypothetical protein